MVKYMFELASDSDFEMLYGNPTPRNYFILVHKFHPWYYSRQATVVVVDEMQNLNFHELDSIITTMKIVRLYSVVMLPRPTLLDPMKMVSLIS